MSEFTPNPAIQMLLRDRAKIDEALRALGYVEGSEDNAILSAPPSADSVDGTYMLTDIGTAPPPLTPPSLAVVKDEPPSEKQKPRPFSEAITKGETWQDGTGTHVVDVDNQVPPVGTNVPRQQELQPVPPADVTDSDPVKDESEADRVAKLGKTTWDGSTSFDRSVIVALSSIKRGMIPQITEELNRIFAQSGRRPYSEATVRRAIYGAKVRQPDSSSLMGRHIVKQTNPHARGRITYMLAEAGRAAVEHARGLGASS